MWFIQMFELIKKSKRSNPKLSFILLDWNVRESFHFCHYLKHQDVSRDLFEIVVIEYYSEPTKALKAFQEDVDTLALLQMPKECAYHKHLMYNIGYLLSQGEILVICDSDAMAKPSFVSSILAFFETHSNAVLHLDQFRNHRTDLYPFCYPSFEEVVGPGCINWSGGKTTGVVDTVDRLHLRNYGSCFCCTKGDFLLASGADEHIDFVGHICGPYDLTFRLMNLGKQEVWHETEFLYHTWHPGSDGVGEYMGPHDGYNLSTTSLEALWSGRTAPHVVHPLIQKQKEGKKLSLDEILKEGVNATHQKMTSPECLRSSKAYAQATYSSFLPLKNETLSKWETFQFFSMTLFHKAATFLKKTLPILVKAVTKTGAQTKQQWTTLNQATQGQMNAWKTLSYLYKRKVPHYIVVNSQRDLLILTQLLLWKKKMSFRSHHCIELLFLGDLNEKQRQKLVEKKENGSIHVMENALYDWKQYDEFKNLEVSLI
jgi:hypothetical protein